MRVLFLGTYIPEDKFIYFKQISSYLDYPGFILQNNLHAGMAPLVEMRAIVVPALHTNYANRKISGYQFDWNGTKDNYSIAYTNVRGVKEVSVPKIVQSTLHEQGYVPDVVFVYSLGTIPYTIATKIKQLHPHTKIVSIIADLPQYMSDNKNPIYRMLKGLDGHIVNSLIKQFDGFCLLSPHMIEKLPIKDKPWLLVEGIYNTINEPDNIPHVKKKIVLYTGALERRYGLIDLVNAFTAIPYEDVELWLCGNGGAVDEIKEIAAKDKRIKYKGVVSHKDVLVYQRQATLLINPRHSSEEFAKYSFPSKTMEYLASGTPTLMCRLKSIPTEYEDHLFFFENEDIEGFKNKLVEVLSYPSELLKEKGTKARSFILNHKTKDVQAKRIINFLRSL